MNSVRLFTLLTYFISMEDSSLQTDSHYLSPGSKLEEEIAWLAPLKTILWMIMAIAASLCLDLLTQ